MTFYSSLLMKASTPDSHCPLNAMIFLKILDALQYEDMS